MIHILYCPETEVALTDYGIEIPLSANRRLQIVEHLQMRWGSEHVVEGHPAAYSKDELLRVHTPDYVQQLFHDPHSAVISTFELLDANGRPHRFNPQHAKRPLSEMVQLHLAHARGSQLAMSMALKEGECFYAGGGMHHAMDFGGRGFCLVNDIVLGLTQLKMAGDIKHAWVIDVDAHKGDGTAQLAQTRPWIKTLSIHMAEGWPLDSGDEQSPWFIPSTIDIGIGTSEESQYLPRLRAGMEALERLQAERPQLAVVVLGADPWEGDMLPSTSLIKLTQAQMLERDIMVHEFLRSRAIPVAYVMAGGYGDRSWIIYAQFLDYLLAKK